ncbi:MAG TPA: flagellar export chaperone FliS [Planctomycetota bacterium]|nr:flagellar export chaperone FliS [Planctomycetota bacterium]
MTYAQAAATYQKNAILTTSPEKLVKMLYEGALKHLEKSRIGLADAKTARSAEVGESLSRAIGILGELRASLDHAAGGPIARDLDRLYEFALDQLSQANLTRTEKGVTHALQVMRTLKEGWDGIIPG